MTVIDYLDTTNWFVHHVLVPDYNMPFLLWCFMVIAGGSLIFTLINNLLWRK